MDNIENRINEQGNIDWALKIILTQLKSKELFVFFTPTQEIAQSVCRKMRALLNELGGALISKSLRDKIILSNEAEILFMSIQGHSWLGLRVNYACSFGQPIPRECLIYAAHNDKNYKLREKAACGKITS